jgi:hypothetical protein
MLCHEEKISSHRVKHERIIRITMFLLTNGEQRPKNNRMNAS